MKSTILLATIFVLSAVLIFDISPQCAAVVLPASTFAVEPCRRVVDKGNDKETQWFMETNTANTRDFSVKNYNDAKSVIAQVTTDLIDKVMRSGDTVVSSGTMKVDVQGRFTSGNRRFVNLQVQINRPRANANDRTTVATALIETTPDGSLSKNDFMSTRYVRDALLRSLSDCQARQCRVIRVTKSSPAVNDQEMVL